MKDSQQTADSKKENTETLQNPKRLRTGLLMLGSAVFGGIAVVLWNRRILASMQDQTREEAKKSSAIDNDAIY
jgi:hypothetical protein